LINEIVELIIYILIRFNNL